MNKPYKYHPVRFYLIVFAFTWAFWFTAAIVYRMGWVQSAAVLMLLGLFVPSVTALTTVIKSKSAALKADLKAKLVSSGRIRPKIVILSIVIIFAVIIVSILLSALFGQSMSQFSFVAGFSFSIGGIPTLFTLVLTAFLEEMGWRGYAEDAIASYMSWFKESVIFGLVWALWHMPLFLIPDTYQYNILQQSPWFMVNFFVSIIPLGFIFTWVYAKNHRSIFACMFFHFAVNFLQEEIAMTQVTKCVETLVLYAAVIIIVAANRDLFFETRHVGDLLGEIENTDTPATA